MLNTKILSISATSSLEDGTEIASMYCTLSSSSAMESINVMILNKELYEANMELVRADIDEFTAMCREREDSGIVSTLSEE